LISGKTIFISPLDWGLGHATRCVPIIKSLSKDNTVVIGVSHLNAPFFIRHFPNLQKAELPSYKISYSKNLPAWLKIILQWPKIKSVVKKERQVLKKIISHYKIDVVISDNRFGLTNENVKCIFITHQLNLKGPFSLSIADRVNKKYINSFNEIWVPDYEDKSRRLSGVLSDSAGVKVPVTYIGPQSFLNDPEFKTTGSEKIDYLILLSGVEPQRSILEKILVEKFNKNKLKILLVRGSATNFELQRGNLKVVDFSFGEELKNIIINADTVICRSGYSTLMDLHLLNKNKLILIPTPGQTEQEYLAAYWKKKFNILVIDQGVANEILV
jgi:uncharacterized protein (TIGR00661 family)